MAKTLVWVTHSFRENSKLTASLSGQCAFVYYSPYHFAGVRERQILQSCSQANLDVFYFSINAFSELLSQKLGAPLHVFRVKNVVDHINSLVKAHGFTQVVIDQPMFAMWHTVNISNICCPVKLVDSDLINPSCTKLTAKSRWQHHLTWLPSFQPYMFSPAIQGISLPNYQGKLYPQAAQHDLINPQKVLARAFKLAPAYKNNRDTHNGQLQLSTALHNGILDPATLFHNFVNFFKASNISLQQLDSPAISVLRQLCFREISIIKARHHNLTLENTPLDWATQLMHVDALNNMLSAKPNPTSNVTWQSIQACNTGDRDLDFLLSNLKATGIMPNRARMWFASKVFYDSHTGLDALTSTINTFDLLGLDGQSPNNYTQCIGALGLTYGKILKMNRDAAWQKLGY